MTSTQQRQDRLLKLIREHAAAEAAGDIDAVMATVSRKPLYEFYPLGYRMTDWNTIKEYYRMSLIENESLSSGRISVGELSASFGQNESPAEDVFWFGKESIITRDDLWVRDEKNEKRSMRIYAVFSLDGDLLSGEIMMTTQIGGEIMRPVYEKLYATRAGVSIIK
jgi:hypothetical protein